MEILSSTFAYHILRKHMIRDVEELWCLALGPSLKLLAAEMIFRGTVDSCTAHPRDIFRFACRANASQIIVAHNHPSGEPLPSKDDLDFTMKIVRVGKDIEIPVLDHLILTETNYLSLAETQEFYFKEKQWDR